MKEDPWSRALEQAQEARQQEAPCLPPWEEPCEQLEQSWEEPESWGSVPPWEAEQWPEADEEAWKWGDLTGFAQHWRIPLQEVQQLCSGLEAAEVNLVRWCFQAKAGRRPGDSLQSFVTSCRRNGYHLERPLKELLQELAV